MQKGLLIIGLCIMLLGLLWPWLSKLPFGRLPGDIIVQKPGFSFYFPITTMLLVSVVITLLLWLFKR